MVEILLHYTDRTLKKCPDQGKIQVMEQHFQVQCLTWLFDICDQVVAFSLNGFDLYI